MGHSDQTPLSHLLAQAGFATLPHSWEAVTLADLLAADRGISVGVMYPGDHDPLGVPLIKAGDLTEHRINSCPDFRISQKVHHEYRRTALEGGELLMTLVGNVGSCAVVPPEMRGWNAARAVAVIRLRDLSDASYVRACLQSRQLRHLMDVWSNTTVQQTLNLKEIKQLPIPWPPREARERIANILSALDDKIELNRRMNATLEAIAQALFKSWFVDFDPVRAKAEGRAPSSMDVDTAKLFPSDFVDSELGLIPKGWRTARLVEITNKIGSGATPRGGDKAYVDVGVRLIRSQNVYDSHFTWDGLVCITDEDARRLEGVTVQRDDVLLNITGASILRTCVVDPAVLPARVNQHVAIVRARAGIPPRYIHNHLLRASTKAYLLGMNAGASREAVTKGHIESVQLVEPLTPVLQAWERLVAPLYARIEVATGESAVLAQMRDTLLPRLLSGELPVAAAERELEATA